MKSLTLILLIISIFFLTACKRKFEPINYGHEACSHCRMTIMDKRFAAEMITEKGKVFKFDDFGCLLTFVKNKNLHTDGALIFVADFNHPEGRFLDARQAVYIHDETFRSPMNGNFAAAGSETDANQLDIAPHSKLLTWISLSK